MGLERGRVVGAESVTCRAGPAISRRGCQILWLQCRVEGNHSISSRSVLAKLEIHSHVNHQHN